MDHRFVVPKSMSMHCHVYTAGVQNPDAFIFRDVAVVSMASTLEGLHIVSMLSSGLTIVKMVLQTFVERCN